MTVSSVSRVPKPPASITAFIADVYVRDRISDSGRVRRESDSRMLLSRAGAADVALHESAQDSIAATRYKLYCSIQFNIKGQLICRKMSDISFNNTLLRITAEH
jgi:hypothetical protein